MDSPVYELPLLGKGSRSLTAIAEQNEVYQPSEQLAAMPLSQVDEVCAHCGMQDVCAALSEPDMRQAIIRRDRLVAGKSLFSAGDVFHGIYVVLVGAIKTYVNLGGSHTQIMNFCVPGDAVGIDAVAYGIYTSSARALGETIVCRINIDSDQITPGRKHKVQDEIIRALTKQLRHEQNASIFLRKQTAEQRIATFLIGLAGPSLWVEKKAVELRLLTSRKDIANYLGIAEETLSRLFKRMQAEHVIKSQGRRVQILNATALNELAYLF